MKNINTDRLIDLIKQARLVFVCGNGGSSATAEHFSNDLFSKGVKAHCLNSNTSIMTMIANDFGYKHVFKKQLDVYASSKDLLIVFSCSGDSENVLEALKGNYTKVAILGNNGRVKNMADYVLTVDSDDYGGIENSHLEIVHTVKNKL